MAVFGGSVESLALDTRVVQPVGASTRVLIGLAVALETVAAFLAALLAFGGGQFPAVGILFCAVAWPAILASRGDYSVEGAADFDRSRIPRAWLIWVGGTATYGLLVGTSQAGWTALAALTLPLVVSIGYRGLVRRRVVALRRSGIAVERVLLVGDARSLTSTVDALSRHTTHKYLVVGACVMGDDDVPLGLHCVARLEPGEQSGDGPVLVAAAARVNATEVLAIPSAELAMDRLHRMVWAVHDAGLRLSLVTGLQEVARRRLEVTTAGTLAAMTVRPPCSSGWQTVVKAVAERMLALLGLVIVLPVLAAVAVAIRIDSPGPALYRQARVGRHGRPFTMLKFRTMVVDAELQKAELSTLNENDGRMFKMRQDPRVTRVGRTLRRYSLDELPQLVNVLRGDMALVGPRPPLPDEVEGYDDVERRRLAVRPGITGLWQVSGRADLSWDETLRLDLRYVDNWSLASDLGLVMRTVRAVFEGRGAY